MSEPSVPLRVLFITRKWPPAVGGMETYSVELTRELASRVDLRVQFLPGREDGRPPGGAALVAFFLRMAVLLARGHRDFDLVHFGDLVLFPLAWWHRLFAPRVKRVVTLHGLDIIFGNRTGLAPALYHRFLAWARARHVAIDRYITNSENTARLAREAGFVPSEAVPLGVRLAGLGALEVAEPAVPAYVLFVGRLVRRKGAKWFAEAVLPKLPAGIELHVVGKVWDQDEADALDTSPRVRRLGYLDDAALAEVRRRALAIVMPNIASPGNTDVEGFGLTALEASASGAPLVAADIEGISDAVRDGETGYLVPSGDAGAWTTAIEKIAAWTYDERSAFARRAWESLEREYSWQRVAEQTVDAYRRCLTGY